MTRIIAWLRFDQLPFTLGFTCKVCTVVISLSTNSTTYWVLLHGMTLQDKINFNTRWWASKTDNLKLFPLRLADTMLLHLLNEVTKALKPKTDKLPFQLTVVFKNYIFGRYFETHFLINLTLAGWKDFPPMRHNLRRKQRVFSPAVRPCVSTKKRPHHMAAGFFLVLPGHYFVVLLSYLIPACEFLGGVLFV